MGRCHNEGCVILVTVVGLTFKARADGLLSFILTLFGDIVDIKHEQRVGFLPDRRNVASSLCVTMPMKSVQMQRVNLQDKQEGALGRNGGFIDDAGQNHDGYPPEFTRSIPAPIT